jgi:hypothetical protein
MKMPSRLIDCLNENKISYEILSHPEAFAAQRIARAEHVKGRRHAMAVRPADDYIVFEAGTHTEAIRLSYRDYEKIVKPQVEDLAIKLQPMKGV